MKTVLKVLLLVGVSAYLVFALVSLSHSSQKELCEGVDIVIQDTVFENFVDESLVSDILASRKISPQGQRISDIDLAEIQRLINNNPYVDTATCYYTATHRMCIRVSVRRPLFQVISSTDGEYYVDRKGNCMPMGDFCLDLSIVTGNVPKASASRLVELVETIDRDQYWSGQIQQIVVRDMAHVELVPRVGNHRIILGELTDIQSKLDRLQEFYRQGLENIGWNRYATLDVSYDNQLVATRIKK